MTLSLIPSHDVAGWIQQLIRTAVNALGIGSSEAVEELIYLLIIIALSFAIGLVIRLVAMFAIRRMVALRHSTIGAEMLRQRVPTRCVHIIPPMVLLALIPFSFDASSEALTYIRRVTQIYLSVAFGIGINAIITFAWTRYNRRANKERHPIKGILNVAHGIVWIIITIICGSIVLDKSPMALLGGLGAFAAALMLIFKDSILGFVAGLQLSSNDMLRVGDWIVVPSTPANGVVTDVSLTVVKVQNWDNTTIMLPPYTLVSTSFQNWRGMSDSGVRQIQRSVIIDNTSIVAASAELLQAVAARYPEMSTYIAQRQQAQASGEGNAFNGGTAPVNGTIDTNLGLFRAYLCQYLLAHPAISNANNIIVHLLDPTANGTPLEIYCFTSTTDWLAYEAIRSQIFEHIAAEAPAFALRIYNATDSGLLHLPNEKV